MNDLTQVRLAAAEAGDVMQRVIDMMIDGVAFPDDKDRRFYDVFSHEGDGLGRISSASVQFAMNYMKLRGRHVGTLRHNDPCHPGFTFAWVGPHWNDLPQR
jgi:hypothetical protein